MSIMQAAIRLGGLVLMLGYVARLAYTWGATDTADRMLEAQLGRSGQR